MCASKGTTAVAIGFFTVTLMVLLFLLFKPIPTASLISQPRPSPSYEESANRIHLHQQAAPADLAPTGADIFMDHGHRTENVIVFFHGFTSSPRQFELLGQEFFQLGYNVYIPRIPQHGLRDPLTSGFREMTAEKLTQFTDDAVDIAQGLGEHVTVAGLSMGGAMAGWAAQMRPDIDTAVIIAPTFGTSRLPNVFFRATINYFRMIPEHFIWWDSRQKANLLRPTGTYHGFSSHAFGEMRRLSWTVQKLSEEKAPKARRIVVITNANDRAVRKEGIEIVATNWERQGVQVERFELPDTLNVEHDIIDPEQPYARVSVIYPQLLKWIVPRSEITVE